MPNEQRDRRILGGLLIGMIAVAIVLGLTKFKIPTVKNVADDNTNATTNINDAKLNTAAPVKSSSTNTNTMTYQFPGVLPADQIHQKQVHIVTSRGDIIFSLDDAAAPKAVSNFVYLTDKKFYDGLVFHRVEDWVTQGGDPEGTGRGGPGYSFPDETVTQDYTVGTVGMANSGPDTNGSQFFFVKVATPLPKSYTIFGHVTKGMDVVNALQIGDAMTSVTVENAS